MTMKKLFALPLFAAVVGSLLLSLQQVSAQSTAFIYQDFVDQGLPSDLLDGTHKVSNGSYTFTFRLATAATGSNYVGSAITNPVVIASKEFSTPLDFDNVFDGQLYWVEIARKVGKEFVTLTPRQLLPSAPYALYAYTAGTIAASNVSGGSITINATNGLSGGGTVALGGSITLSNTGVLSVTGSGGINAATLDGAVTLSLDATNGDTAGTLVERDGSGNFSANSVALNSLSLPDPGAIYSGSNAVLYSDSGTGDFFAGLEAGNSPNGGGSDNTASGFQALFANGTINTSGTAVHYPVGPGNNNTANGYQSLYNNGTVNISGEANEQRLPSVGNNNTASGFQALFNNGNLNISGANIQQTVTVGDNNTAAGYQALYNNGIVNVSGGNIQQLVTVGNNNTAYGYQALLNNGGLNDGGGNIQSPITSGNDNIALGYQAGTNIISGNNNIDIGASGPSDESAIIRIGNPSIQTATYLSGTVYANGVELTSDRNAKEQFAPVNAQAVLDKVAALPISEWKFKTDKSVQHIGPMAQDFKAAFNVGTDDRHIAVVDEGGVALAAIQGLNLKLNEKDAEIQMLKAKADKVDSLEQQNVSLAQRLHELEAAVKALAEKK
jgi:trimeric autotransporter adhesin